MASTPDLDRHPELAKDPQLVRQPQRYGSFVVPPQDDTEGFLAYILRDGDHAIEPREGKMVVRVPRLIQVFNVQCVMCGRAAGQLMSGTFVPNQRVRTPVPCKTGSRCGECGGNLYLEPDESVTPFMATQIAAQRTAAQQQAQGLKAAA